MSDDSQVEHTDAAIVDVVAAMVVQMDRGQQFYAFQVGTQWAIFWNGPVAIH